MLPLFVNLLAFSVAAFCSMWKKMNISFLVLVSILFTLGGNITGQSFSINSFSLSEVCQGNKIDINCISEGTFNSDNVFYAQLSDELGSFSTYKEIGFLKSSEKGLFKISASIPVNTNPGVGYLIRVVSSDPEYKSAGIPITIKPVPQQPDITILGETTFCQGESVTLIASKGTSYEWSNGEITQSIDIFESGNYFVTVENNEGCSAISEVINVIVNPLPEAVINKTSPTTFCQGESVVLSASAGVSYLWNNEVTTRENEVNSTDSYFVTVTDVNGCSATSKSIEVIVNPLPPQPIITSEGSTSLCKGSSVKLISSAGETYSWSNGVTNQENVVNISGQYSVTISDCNGCKSTSLPAVVTMNQLPDQPIIKFDGELTFCKGGSVKLTSSEGESYLWSNGATTREIEVFSSDSYYVRIFDKNECSAISEPIVVNVNPLPQPIITLDEKKRLLRLK